MIAKIRNKPLLLLGSIIILSVIVIGWNVFTIMWIDREMAGIIRQVEELAELEEAQVFLLKQEVTEQQYLLSDNNLEPLIQHKQFETLADFHLKQAHRFQSTPEDITILTKIEHDRDAYEAVFAQIVELYRNGAVDEAIRLSFEESEPLIQDAQQQVEAFVVNVEQKLEAEVGNTDQLAWMSLIISLFLGFVFMGIGYLALALDNRVLKSILLSAIFISLTVVGWNVYNVWRLKGEVRSVVTHLEELDQVALTEIFLLEQEIAELEYLLSGDEIYIERHQELEAATDEHWQRALTLQTTADEGALLSALKEDHDAYEQVFKAIVTAYQQGDKAEAVRLSIEDAAVSLDDVQRRVDEFISQTTLRMEAKVVEVDRLTAVALTIGIFTFIILTIEAVISTTATARVQTQQLRIQIDNVKRKQQVSEIVETDFFQDLQNKAKTMRSRRAGSTSTEDTPADDEPKT